MAEKAKRRQLRQINGSTKIRNGKGAAGPRPFSLEKNNDRSSSAELLANWYFHSVPRVFILLFENFSDDDYELKSCPTQ